MSEADLKRLIEKYYDGLSTDEDEKALRGYFSTSDVPPGYEAEKEMFGLYMDSVPVPAPSADFEERIIKAIDYQSAGNGTGRFRKMVVPLLSAAAGILILAGSYFLLVNRNKPEDTFKDPQLAYAETMKILKDVSYQMNRATSSLEPVAKINEVREKSLSSINKSAALIGKNLRSLGYLKQRDDKNNAQKGR